VARGNYGSTKANQEFANALTDDATFGVPRYTTALLPAAATGNKGAVAYDTTLNSFVVSTGSAWVSIGGTGAAALANGSTVSKGTGSATAVIGGVLNVNTTSQATTGTVEEVLATYTLPANTLSANGKGLRVTVWGTVTGNTNAKVLRVRFGGIGGTQIATVSTSTAAHTAFYLTASVVRTGAATQASTGVGTVGQTGGATSSVSTSVTTPAQTLSGAVDVVVTGTTASASGEATFSGLIVEAIN
jgi:hypothetical protein